MNQIKNFVVQEHKLLHYNTQKFVIWRTRDKSSDYQDTNNIDIILYLLRLKLHDRQKITIWFTNILFLLIQNWYQRIRLPNKLPISKKILFLN